MKIYGIIVSGIALMAGCADTADTQTAPRLAIATAPLQLDQASDACYTLTVYNDAIANLGTADTVTQLQHVCGSQYGFETEISYVAPCDAQGNNGDPDFKPNTVTLVLENICSGGACDDDVTPSNAIATSEYVNPCPASAPCTQEIVCRENADVPVNFNLTVMRDAQQGFFDVAVDFSDLFCSAKFDCRGEDNELLSLLHDCQGDRADFTSVLAVACTRGPGNDGAATTLYMDPISITCDDDFTLVLAPIDGPGNGLDACVGVPGDDALTVFQHAVYVGQESLGCDDDNDALTPDVDCNKVYLNNAIGFDAAELATHPNCRIRTTVAVADGALPGGMTDAAASYPVLRLDIPLTNDDNDIVCSQHPVGSPGFAFDYTNAPTAEGYSESFRYESNGTDVHVVDPIPVAHQAAAIDFDPAQKAPGRHLEVAPAGLRVNPKVIDGVLDANIYSIKNVGPSATVAYTPPAFLIDALLTETPELQHVIGFHNCASNAKLDTAAGLATCTKVGEWKSIYSDCTTGEACQAKAAQTKTKVPAGANTMTIAIGKVASQTLATSQDLAQVNASIYGEPSDGPGTVMNVGTFFNCPAGPPCGDSPCVVVCIDPHGDFTAANCCFHQAPLAADLLKALLDVLF